MRLVNVFIQPIIKEALNRKQTMVMNEADEPLLDHLVKATNGEAHTFSQCLLSFILLLTDPVVIKEWLCLTYPNISSNSAAALTFVAYFLAIYPKILLRGWEEVLDKIGPFLARIMLASRT